MMNMKKIFCSAQAAHAALFALVTLSASSLAHAEGVYVGANVSPSTKGELYATERGVTTTYPASSKARPFGVFAGYDLTPEWALEGGYRRDAGSTGFDLSPDYHLKATLSTAYLAARGNWKLSDTWALFGKAGIAQGRMQLDFSGKAAPVDATAHTTGLYLSVGASYLLDEHLALQLALEHSPQLQYQGYRGKADRLSLGLSFGF